MFLQQQPITKQFSVEFSTHKVNTNNEQLARNARAMKNKHKTNIVRANKRKANCNCCCDDIETIMCLRNISQKVWKRGIKTGRTGTTSTTYIHDPSHQMAKLNSSVPQDVSTFLVNNLTAQCVTVGAALWRTSQIQLCVFRQSSRVNLGYAASTFLPLNLYWNNKKMPTCFPKTEQKCMPMQSKNKKGQHVHIPITWQKGVPFSALPGDLRTTNPPGVSPYIKKTI